ncbi:MAG TPA: bifunctional alpha,alpha-trehalose-phosphate synthase (UDP-forming)/trehalose-phosphatase, partial [Candidatus Limnocylindrales bacterium]|nr:bifunctional alpha,alpha-trehalose-phosphate synthase (UDP-forming)/trehalose-phosphatase [Candidatus Limnocylindrales bacterium]
MPRVILVSHRLPISARVERGELVVANAAGGVATGLLGIHERGNGLWVGWPGETWRLGPGPRAALSAELRDRRAIPVELEAGLARRFYEDFSSAVLWPLLHYQLERLPLDPKGWDAYREANERFAEAIVSVHRPGDVVWVHDYQLLLVPGLLRQRLPDATIGFFLHVPFPSSELFRVLRWRRDLLEGMLGADLVGFHTEAYANHFRRSAAQILGCEVRNQRIAFQGRRVRAGAFPMGIDADAYEALAEDPAVLEEARQLRRDGVELVVAVDRLDYTKGIPRRLLAFERCLERHPALRSRIRLVQVAVPTREAVPENRDYGSQVDELVGRINGRFGSVDRQPIHYVSRTLPREQLVALHRAASVALVTPVRDGMNLVAKEFVASRSDEDGVLVLSEFAGAAAELVGALIVNPYDLDGVADAIAAAIEMPREERRRRMASLRARVLRHDVTAWARDILAALDAEGRRRLGGATTVPPTLETPPTSKPSAVAAAAPAEGPLACILDYDGTLVPFQDRPSDARPDVEILRVLTTLASLPEVSVDVVTGRRRSEVEEWLGHLPIGLHAEHGLWSRPSEHANAPASDAWIRRLATRPAWMDEVRGRLEQRARDVPGSSVEEKEASLVWHYRTVDERVGEAADPGIARGRVGVLARPGPQAVLGVQPDW